MGMQTGIQRTFQRLLTLAILTFYQATLYRCIKAMQSLKKSTLLTGLPVSKNPHIILTSLYNRILEVLAVMPEESSYRRHTNEIIQSRLNAVQKISDVPTLESTIDCGQIEEVILQARREYDLARNMLKWKPWEQLVEEAPHDQWKWPL
uniref:NADH dehydrogenase (Ubiquinone) 1 alpha subcomplex 5 n=5 Tax=Schistosoma japonicum TaxID=6182 RepID=C1LLL5_SCHJA|nr:NADH dehydrogenase (ubiquinone) 1 alpha subcomplex 5 [Schistosoma japonicum]